VFVASKAAVALMGCSPTNEYGGYTKEEAKDAGTYGLEQLARTYADDFEAVGLPSDFSAERYELIGAEHSTSSTGSDAWLITFVNDQLRDQVCINVWRNDETGDRGRCSRPTAHSSPYGARRGRGGWRRFKEVARQRPPLNCA
jgi:hypothetical protein